MNYANANRPSEAPDAGWLSRERVLALTLVVATVVVFYLCYRLVLPFLPPLAWALALAVMAHPMHRWINRWIPHSNLAAGLSVVVVALVIVVPVIFVTHRVIRETGNFAEKVQNEFTSGRWRSVLERNPRLKPVVSWMESRLGMSTSGEEKATTNDQPGGEKIQEVRVDPSQSSPGVAQVQRAADALTRGAGTVLTGTLWLLMQLFITLMALFFFFRDRHRAIGVLRSLVPLSNTEADEVLARVDDTIHATIYGSVIVAIVQGCMGGLIFWWLELPSPLVWGLVMGLLAVVPMLGTFVIWAPTAAYLALQGDWKGALILASWGAIAIGTVDNFLYPFLVGKRLRFHTLLVFFSILGGLALFGASGVILGPLLLALADALLEIWRRRTAFGGTIEGGIDSCSS